MPGSDGSDEDSGSSSDEPGEQPRSSDPEPSAKQTRRTNGQRAVIFGAAFAAALSLLSAGALAAGQYFVQRRQVVELADPSDRLDPGGTTSTAPASDSTSEAVSDANDANDANDASARTDPPGTPAPTRPTFPDADPAAKNFLITGADNNDCATTTAPENGGLGDREGERSDTIVIWRVDPSTSRAAVLSLPRDLWVTIPNAGQSRINSTYQRDNPQLLIDTIFANFGIGIDHFVQVDFCAFKTLVDAVGGVSVPFQYPARDTESGLNVPTAGCFEFDGDAALAYVRSRYYEYLPPGVDPIEGWEEDYSSDLGRISRQQDFMRRMLARVLDKGAFNPSVARSLIRATTDYVVTDNELSPQKLLSFAGVLRRVDPEAIPNYQITATPTEISGNAVLLPDLGSTQMQEVLSLFRGAISLTRLPTTAPAPSTTAASPAESSAGGGRRAPEEASSEADTSPTASPPTTVPPTAPPTTVADNAPEDIEYGIVPPAIACD